MMKINRYFLSAIVMLMIIIFPIRFLHKGSIIKSSRIKICCTDLYADEKSAPIKSDADEKAVKADHPGSDNTLYKVMGIILVIWIGLAVFLFMLDRKVSSLEKDLKNQQS